MLEISVEIGTLIEQPKFSAIRNKRDFQLTASTDCIICKPLENRTFHAGWSVLGVQVNLLSRHLYRILDKGHCESKAVSSFGVVKPVFASMKLEAVGDNDSADDDYEKLVLYRDNYVSRVSLRSSIIFPRVYRDGFNEFDK